jgi:hypothetical protein
MRVDKDFFIIQTFHCNHSSYTFSSLVARRSSLGVAKSPNLVTRRSMGGGK